MQLAPGMHETVLCQIVRERVITCQLAQKIAHMRLVPSDQFAESGSILSGYCPCDQVTIFARSQLSISVLAAIRKSVQYQIRDTQKQRKRGYTHENPCNIIFVGDTETKCDQAYRNGYPNYPKTQILVL